MSDTRPLQPSRASISSWLTAQLAVRSQHTRRSIAIIAMAIAVIGWADHQSGFQVSFELFYLVPITMAVAWLGPRAGCIAAVMSIVVRVAGDLMINPETVPLSTFWNWLTDLLVYLVIVGVIHGLISLYRELDRRVEDRTHELQESIRVRRQLERELLEIAAHERNAVGQELHDDLCQHLVGTAFATKVLAEYLAMRDATAARDAHAIVDYVEDAIAKARRLSRGLLLDSIPPSELPDALAELTAKSSEGGVPCQFLLEGDPSFPTLPPALNFCGLRRKRCATLSSTRGQRTLKSCLAGAGRLHFSSSRTTAAVCRPHAHVALVWDFESWHIGLPSLAAFCPFCLPPAKVRLWFVICPGLPRRPHEFTLGSRFRRR